MKVIYLGANASAVEGLKYLIEKKIKVVAVVTSRKNILIDVANKYKIPSISEQELYNRIADNKFKNIDLVISVAFKKLIRKSLINLAKIGCINFHPAPLPEFGGMGGIYNFGIYEEFPYWGASAHFVDESFDTGDLIATIKFKVEMKEETVFSLKEKAHKYLIKLFKIVIDKAYENGYLSGTPQGKGRYISSKAFERLRKIQSNNSLEEINKKIRAFWYPPYQGAYIRIKGQEFTLINDELLRRINEK